MRAVKHEPGKAWQREGGWIGAGIASAARRVARTGQGIGSSVRVGRGHARHGPDKKKGDPRAALWVRIDCV